MAVGPRVGALADGRLAEGLRGERDEDLSRPVDLGPPVADRPLSMADETPYRPFEHWLVRSEQEDRGRGWQTLCRGCSRDCKVYQTTHGKAMFVCWDYEGKEGE